MRPGNGQVWVLGSRTDANYDGVEDFDGAGPRTVTPVTPFQGVRPEGWIADVDPPIPDPLGVPHRRVLLFPSYPVDSLTEMPAWGFVIVEVGPAPGQAPERSVGRSWHRGELARRVEDLPPTTTENFARRLQAFQRWLAASGDPNPDCTVVFDGVRVGGFVGYVKMERLQGRLSPEVAAQFEAIPGWRWWESDDIDLLVRFVRREGHCFVPPGHLEEGRPLGLAARHLAYEYRREQSLVDAPGGAQWCFMSPADKQRLEAIPGWQEFVATAHTQKLASLQRLWERLGRDRPESR
jgi:hypothetical protein